MRYVWLAWLHCYKRNYTFLKYYDVMRPDKNFKTSQKMYRDVKGNVPQLL